MNAKATAAAIAVKIVMVNAVVKSGEKVFNAYMIVSIRFNCCCWWWWVGSARLFSFCSSVVNRNEWVHRLIASLGALYAHKTKVSSFFLKFFFRWGVGARVWARGCGRVGREVGAAGWGWAGAG